SQTLPFRRLARGEIESHFDSEGDIGFPFPPLHLYERRRITTSRRRDGLRLEAWTPVAVCRKFHIPESLLPPHNAGLNSGKVKMLNLPRTIIAPNAPPHKPELAGGPFAVSVPILAAGDDRLIVQVPPVGYVEADGAEPHGGYRLRRDYTA